MVTTVVAFYKQRRKKLKFFKFCINITLIMAVNQHLNNLIAGISRLPVELENNFGLMKDLDLKTQQLMHKIDENSDEFLQHIKQYKGEERNKVIQGIQEQYDQVKAISDFKVDLAIKTYELVDSHIQRLDNDMVQIRAMQEGTKKPTKKKKKQKRDRKAAASTTNGPNEEEGESSLPADYMTPMPVDPNEPRYCLCNQVSYGEMIACDSKDCAIEWFHFECLNMSKIPDGKWYCPVCVENGISQ